MRIVFAIEQNCADIAEIEKACFAAPWSCDDLKQALKFDTRLLIATVGDKTAGYVGVQVTPDGGYITNVAVLPQYRRRGIAKALLNRLCTVSDTLGLSFLSLEVRESNFAARSLYEEVGFTQVGIRPSFYTNPKEHAVIMTKYFISVVRN